MIRAARAMIRAIRQRRLIRQAQQLSQRMDAAGMKFFMAAMGEQRPFMVANLEPDFLTRLFFDAANLGMQMKQFTEQDRNP